MMTVDNGKTRTVSDGMWCPECGSVVQVHVDEGKERDRLEAAVRKLYPSHGEWETVCVLAHGTGVSLYVRKGDQSMGISTGWSEVFGRP